MIQAETNGLYIGLAPNAAPADWDSALTNVDNSTLMTLGNCSSWAESGGGDAAAK